MVLTRLIVYAIAAAWFALLPHQSARAEGETASKVAEAKQLLDTYYGSRESLRRAGTLLDAAIDSDATNADAYVQAARLTIMGGHIVREKFRPNTVESYHALLNKALSIDPANKKAHILKAEAYDIQKNYPQEKASLDKAKGLGSTDPWLSMGYARYYGRVGDHTSAYYFYSKVQELGPGNTAEQRKAYVSALSSLARFKPLPGEPDKLKELASLAWRERHPTDAWTLGTFADEFVFHGMFDDALVYAREALRTMNYGAGRLTLAVSLYGKSAQLIAQDKRGEANKLISEARRLGFDGSDVLSRLEGSSQQVESLMPILEEIVK